MLFTDSQTFVGEGGAGVPSPLFPLSLPLFPLLLLALLPLPCCCPELALVGDAVVADVVVGAVGETPPPPPLPLLLPPPPPPVLPLLPLPLGLAMAPKRRPAAATGTSRHLTLLLPLFPLQIRCIVAKDVHTTSVQLLVPVTAATVLWYDQPRSRVAAEDGPIESPLHLRTCSPKPSTLQLVAAHTPVDRQQPSRHESPGQDSHNGAGGGGSLVTAESSCSNGDWPSPANTKASGDTVSHGRLLSGHAPTKCSVFSSRRMVSAPDDVTMSKTSLREPKTPAAGKNISGGWKGNDDDAAGRSRSRGSSCAPPSV